jgi:hypothetical protein
MVARDEALREIYPKQESALKLRNLSDEIFNFVKAR